ncbi:ferredoxin-type protein NapF [Parashewanella curva]|uniref:Ferredoxin-type protein NapF n=1 Tax=Parashewanella curva TaxID=2338552 RepID=A0A3L8Q1Q3_9GAMM|nr:ferredoxin-type protein NapF [Parashewanella curva]RLV61525.1 ferredoxin-type protein NapF [Parashewanella curva]
MTSRVNLGRRRLFSRRKIDANRPPWVKQDIEFTDICSRCDACITACETKIIFRGDGGFPEVDFNKGECTFCEQCVNACKEPIFDIKQAQPWEIKAQVKDNCLAHNGVWCQSCQDMCEPEAIRFEFRINQAPIPIIDTQACTGCGACVEPCPTNAIKITEV